MMRTGKTSQSRSAHHRTTGEGGFTLMEVLIAITILSVGLLAIASMQITAIQTTGGAKSISRGVLWAEDRMEMLTSLPYSNAMLNDTGGNIPDPSPPANFNISWTVDDNNPRTSCKLITVTVQWSERGVSKTTTLTSVKPEL